MTVEEFIHKLKTSRGYIYAPILHETDAIFVRITKVDLIEELLNYGQRDKSPFDLFWDGGSWTLIQMTEADNV